MTGQMKDNTRLAYTRKEAAGLLGINPISLDRLAKQGLIHPSRALQRPLYARTELVRFLEDTQYDKWIKQP
tara:strand:- start:789 stop:1001 length:213 start_codon:yes stop_codon:yes gene_type:complete